ncbi:MAG TPA: hypothetical protein VKT70_01120 [Stellaceae bacterium]|nr:hypothetical protein [Stellaceae bacterium]
MPRFLAIEGKRFELSVTETPPDRWHWIATAPGEVVLSGEATSERQALESACRAASGFARFETAFETA